MNTHSKQTGWEVKRLSVRITEVFEGDPWYGTSIRQLLASVNPEWMFLSPGPGAHTIADLMAHMIGWREVAIRRLQGDADYLPDQEDTFNWRLIAPERSTAWQILTERLAASQNELLALLEQFDESALDRTVPGMSYSYRTLLEGVIDHDLYHLGQIALIDKIFRSRYRTGRTFLRYSYRVFPYRFMSLNK